MEADIGIEEWQKADKGIIYPKLTPNTISIYNLRESVDFQYCPPWEGNIKQTWCSQVLQTPL